MRARLKACAALATILGLAACACSRGPSGPAFCRPVMFEGKHFTECIAVPGKNRIATRLAGPDGIPYRGFGRLERDVERKDSAGGSAVQTVAFAINGGMYDESGQPIGYYAESGRRLHPLDRRTGKGNFYLKPNGVFFGDAGGPWRVATSEDFARNITATPGFATQSGPMLLVDGAIPPTIAPNGPSLNLRNAVGIDAAGKAHFVIADEPISFGTIARLMRDHARARNALYLDGAVSALWNPATGRMDDRAPLGPLIVVSVVK